VTFLVPWVLGIGALAALGVVALHLIARDVPPRWLLPTARFVPAARTDVLTRTLRPRDPWLLLVRLALVAALAVAAADPVRQWRSREVAQVVIADLSRATAERSEVVRTARTLLGDGGALVVLDTIARQLPIDSLEPLAQRTSLAMRSGAISAALLAAYDAARDVRRTARRVTITLVSPVAREQFDAATDSIRALWPDSIRVVPVRARTSPAVIGVPTVRGPITDALRATVERIGGANPDSMVRLVRDSLTTDDLRLASAGGVVIDWPVDGPYPDSATAVATRTNVVIAPLRRRTLRAAVPLPSDSRQRPASVVSRTATDSTQPPGDAGRAIAWWADGTPAAIERSRGTGCLREVGIGVPAAGDLVLTARFTELVRTLTRPCGAESDFAPADSATMQRLVRAPERAQSMQVADVADPTLVRAALAVAVALLLLELLLRRPRPIA
jgi:predicted nicotinamide N-methyase